MTSYRTCPLKMSLKIFLSHSFIFLASFLLDLSPGSNNSFAERLTNMGMPSNTAALVDACDPASGSSSPKSQIKRMHSDTTVVTRKAPSPPNGEKSGILYRPMSLMPAVRHV